MRPQAGKQTGGSRSELERTLDWLNFWVADVQTGVGPFLAAFLTARGWNPSQVGTMLTVGSAIGLAMQTPAGAVVDSTRRKRTLVVLGVSGVVLASLLLAYGSSWSAFLTGQVLLGGAGAFITPAITAITLGLVGKSQFDTRLGRNNGFNSAGNVFAAMLMGWVGWRWGPGAIFLTVPFLAVPTLLGVWAIPASQIDHRQARGSDSVESAGQRSGLSVIVHDRVLFAFALSGFLFHLANAAMLPQLSELLARGNSKLAPPFMSAAVCVTQLVIALSSVRIGRISAAGGPRPLLKFGYAVLPIRGILYTLTSHVTFLILIQVLDGIANAIFLVTSALFIADRTRGSGHFNLAMGGFATITGIGAALSTALAGSITQAAGFRVSFLCLSAIAALALVCLVLFVPDSRKSSSDDETLRNGLNLADVGINS